jgi:hypothetical protein
LTGDGDGVYDGGRAWLECGLEWIDGGNVRNGGGAKRDDGNRGAIDDPV